MLRARLRLSVLARFLGRAGVIPTALLVSTHSAAQEPGFELQWRGPAECSERARAVSSVERLLGAAPEQVAAPPLSALATVVGPAPGEWQLTLFIARAGTSRTRELTGHSCAELADAVALILALAVDPEVFSRKIEAEGNEGSAAASAAAALGAPSGAEAPDTAATQVPAAPQASLAQPSLALPDRESADERRTLAFIALGPNATFGVIATPAFGVSLSGGLSSQALRLGVTASYFPQRRANSAEQPVLAAVMDLRTLALWACWMNRLSGALRGGACGVTELGAIGARGEGATRVHSQTKLWGATGLGGVLLLGLGRDFDFGLEAAAMLPWGRPEFVVAGARIHEPSPAVGGVRALLEARFR